MRRNIHTDKAPKAIGPYAPGVACGDLLFVSGQIALDPATNALVAGDIRAQTRRALQNLKAVIEAAGFSLADTVKCTCYLQNMDHFAEFNAVYAEFFPQQPPARSTFQVAALPLGALIEIETIAVRK